MTATVRQLCGAHEAACICVLEPGHKTPHVCSCGGSWYWDHLGNFRIASFPNESLPTIEARP